MSNEFWKLLETRTNEYNKKVEDKKEVNLSYIKKHINNMNASDIYTIKQIIEKLQNKKGKRYLIYTLV